MEQTNTIILAVCLCWFIPVLLTVSATIVSSRSKKQIPIEQFADYINEPAPQLSEEE